MKVVVLLLSVCIGALSCVTVSEDNTPPAITKEMPVQERFDVALKFGGASLKNVKKVTTIEKQWPEMAKVARTYLRNNVRSAEREEIIRAAQIYQSSVPALEPKVLQIFTRHPSQEISVIGWQLAALRPSEELKTFIEEEVSYFVMRGKETRILMPELASAIMENEVHSVYSVLELGLSENKGDDFAKAMIALNPDAAAGSFMDYLNIATIEDLRQMNQTTVDVYTCLVILRFFMNNPLPLGHQGISQLFAYAVSRNSALSDMAREVIDRQVPSYKEAMTFALASLPMRVQIAFVEGSRRNPSSNYRLLLSHLRQVTRYHQVIEEIDAIKIF